MTYQTSLTLKATLRTILTTLFILAAVSACATPPPTTTPFPTATLEPASTPTPSSPVPTDIASRLFDMAWDDRAIFREGLTDADGAKLALRHAVEALKSYNARLGVYPYTEFDVVSTPMQALGIEYPGIVGIALNLYDPDEGVWGLPAQVMIEGTVAHEVAHQWFYNVVGNDQIDEPWLDEAVVQYVTSLYYVDVYGERGAQGFRDSWYGRWDGVDRADIPIGMPAGAYVDKEYGAIVYGRGPIFIATLAEKLGQEKFDEFLRDYYGSHKWGIGTGDAFKQLAERHCQCDLTALFEEWVYEK